MVLAHAIPPQVSFVPLQMVGKQTSNGERRDRDIVPGKTASIREADIERAVVPVGDLVRNPGRNAQ
jgi:hypothetical protein